MHVLSLLADPNAWAALLTLTVLEIVLGIDNLVFISVLTSRLDPERARRARRVGLSLAFVFRVIMLAGLTWLMGLTAPLFSIFHMGISWRDIILIGGGPFPIAKPTHEIHPEVEASARGRSGVLARLDHHRHRHGRGPGGDDIGRGHRHDRHVCGGKSGRRLHRR